MKATRLGLLVPVAFAIACGSGGPANEDAEVLPPALADLAATSDGEVDVVDRAAALSGAIDADQAPPGLPLDLAGAGRGALLDIDSAAEVGSLSSEVPRATFNNVLQGVAMAGAADLITGLVIAPPAAAIGITSRGLVVPLGNNSWVATNAVSDGIRTVSGTFVVAWVGVGWIAEMRLSSTDGAYNNTRWFNGFVSADKRIGWWDLYDVYGNVAGVVEWVDDGAGNSEFGIAATSGDNAGDVLAYAYQDDGDAYVGYHDASRLEDLWVHVAPDQSGDLRSPDYAFGAVSCWASATATEPYADAVCP